MKFKQHISIKGYPSALREVFGISEKPVYSLYIFGIGNVVLPTSGAEDILKAAGIKYTRKLRSMKSRVRYLLARKGVGKAIRGKVVRGDIIYTIESNNEREVLDLTEECIAELKQLKVPYKQVCKWICPH